MLELLAQNTRAYANGDPAPGFVGPLWDDRFGIGDWRDAFAQYFCTQIDGLTYLRGGSFQMGHFVIDRSNGEWVITNLGEDKAYYFDVLAGAVNASVGVDGATAALDKAGVMCADRWLRAFLYSNGTLEVQSKPFDLSAGWTSEATYTGLSGSAYGYATWSKTARAGRFYVISGGGPGAVYDADAQEFVSGTAVYLPANDAAFYSPRLKVFLVLDGASVSVYAASPLPSSLSNPAAVGTLTRGRVNTVRVRLLGGNSEPCVGELVNWSLTAGDGELLTQQSQTGADGYAAALYLAPLTGGTNPTIEAQVNF